MWIDNVHFQPMRDEPEIEDAVIKLHTQRLITKRIKRANRSCHDALKANLRTLLPERPEGPVRGVYYHDLTKILPSVVVVIDWCYFDAGNFFGFNTMLLSTEQAALLQKYIPQNTIRHGDININWYDMIPKNALSSTMLQTMPPSNKGDD